MRLNNNDSSVRYIGNIPGSPSPVWAVKVPEKQVYSLRDGKLLAMKLRDVNNNEIPLHAEVILAGKRPGKGIPSEISRTTYRAWHLRDEGDQYDSTKNGMLRLRIPGGQIDLLEEHEFYIMIDSPVKADPNNSFFEVEYEESPFRDA